MSATIQIKRSTTPGKVPSGLSIGELAINTVDGKLYFGDGSTVRLISTSGSTGGGGGGGTVTSVQLSNGTGISLSGTNPITTTGTITITNTAPDQTVTLGNGTGISVTGTYPNFTIANTSPDQTVVLNSGTGINVTGTYPNFTISSTATSINTSSFVSTSSFNAYTQSINNATSSFVVNSQTSSFVQNSQTSSFVTNNQTSSFVTNSQTSSFVRNSQTSSMTVATASYVSGSVFNNTNQALSASYALTSSYALNGVSGGSGSYIPLWSESNVLTSSYLKQYNDGGVQDVLRTDYPGTYPGHGLYLDFTNNNYIFGNYGATPPANSLLFITPTGISISTTNTVFSLNQTDLVANLIANNGLSITSSLLSISNGDKNAEIYINEASVSPSVNLFNFLNFT
jgi:hypothetical protein